MNSTWTADKNPSYEQYQFIINIRIGYQLVEKELNTYLKLKFSNPNIFAT